MFVDCYLYGLTAWKHSMLYSAVGSSQLPAYYGDHVCIVLGL